MPIYEYECKRCRGSFEQFVRNAAGAEEVRCPACGGGDVERRLSVFSARQAAAVTGSAGPCGRCCDPGGPCPLDF